MKSIRIPLSLWEEILSSTDSPDEQVGIMKLFVYAATHNFQIPKDPKIIAFISGVKSIDYVPAYLEATLRVGCDLLTKFTACGRKSAEIKKLNAKVGSTNLQPTLNQPSISPPLSLINNSTSYVKDHTHARETDLFGQPVDTKPKTKFTIPTLEEVKAIGILSNDQSEAFFDWFSSNGWKVGKNQMKDLKAAMRTWKRRENSGYERKPHQRINPRIEGTTNNPNDYAEVPLANRGILARAQAGQ